MKIVKIEGTEILDSRGNPALEAEVVLDDGAAARASVPSGASTGEFEAVELRDGDMSRYCGLGVLKAAANINGKIAKQLAGMDAADIYAVDAAMIALDGTKDKSRLGANAVLAVSLACARAASESLKIPLYRFFGGINANRMPVPMMNVINGGAHAPNSLDTQEFMIMPVGARSFCDALRMCAEVFRSLRDILIKCGMSAAVGDEGGFAPDLQGDEDALGLILAAVERAGYRPLDDFVLAIDAASSEWKSPKGAGFYRQPKSGAEFTSDELIARWESLVSKYPIFSIEDGLGESDWLGWRSLTERLGRRVQLVGDDLFATNACRLRRGIDSQCGNSILVKPNQIGSVSETLEAVKTARAAGYSAVLSHRSGETSDDSIADLAVGLNACQIKAGAPSRGERVAKYNRLLRIERALSGSVYAGRGAFNFSYN